MGRPHVTSRPLKALKSAGLTGEITVPGDKSVSHRALILGALAVGQTRISGLLEGDDVLNTAAAVNALGARARRLGEGSWTVDGVGVGGFGEPENVLDFGNSGTGARLMMGAMATSPITATLTGDASLCRRPMGRVLEPLAQFGLTHLSRKGNRLPLTLRGAENPMPVTWRMSVPSAQVKSAILLAGLNAPGLTRVIEKEKTRNHTERMLKGFGAKISVEENAKENTISLMGEAELKPMAIAVPGDPSSAAFPAAAAILSPDSRIIIRNMMMNETRTGLYATLLEMGASLSFHNQRSEGGEPVADMEVSASVLKGVDVPESRAPSMIDEYPVLAVLAAFAEGKTMMRGLAELRVKESDRLAAIAAGLEANGIPFEMGDDWLCVEGRGPDGVAGGGTVATRMDHRIAMAFLVMGLASKKPVTVDDTAMIATSFPGFEAMMQGLGAKFAETGS
ncbi:MAG TPA: 3-phosphoshikimate 1-carboxyvinyltransferase [Micropepsaceae bacterium]|nr:3-phosphoshikimate 1-carboxyvinyltransferase [Micropepsaceae bacterium]